MQLQLPMPTALQEALALDCIKQSDKNESSTVFILSSSTTNSLLNLLHHKACEADSYENHDHDAPKLWNRFVPFDRGRTTEAVTLALASPFNPSYRSFDHDTKMHIACKETFIS